jgi:hypothetical protein
MAAIMDDVSSNHEYPATFIFKAGSVMDTMERVGFRIRGNTSRYSAKKSFKVSFNTFEAGRKLCGLEKLNINGEHNDPSVIRSKLCWDILGKMGVPASRANHVELWINAEYYGLYINVEHVDEEFAYSRFGNRDGNLYKCLWPADLSYISDNPDDYKFIHEDRRTYELHTNTRLDDYSDLAYFIDIINNTSDNELRCALENIFNVDNFIKVLAFDAVSGNWDNYSYLKNNYYLYKNTATGKFEFIPYDLDNTFGIDWIGRDWAIRDIYNWENQEEDRPLHRRILGIQEYRDRYSWYVHQLVTEIIDPPGYFEQIDAMRDMISPYISNDPLYPIDYGYSVVSFHQSYNEALGGHVAYGLKPFITARIASINQQINISNIVPVITSIEWNFPRIGESPVINAMVRDDDPDLRVELIYSVNGAALLKSDMKDDGLAPDLTKADDIYAVALDPLESHGRLSFRVRGYTPGGTETLAPCDAITGNIIESEKPDLVINEFMAGNTSAISDEYGEYDDWVELYNRDSNPVWLGDKYLSDDIRNPSRWKLPDSTIQPGELVLIWTDGNNWQGPTHSNFRLRKSGEEIGIFESPRRNSRIIDYMVFDNQTDNHSFGRQTDGAADWISFIHPTPGISNIYTRINTVLDSGEDIVYYPNPVSDGIMFFSQPTPVKLHDLTGRLLFEERETSYIELRELPAGIYLIRIRGGQTGRIILPNQ